MNRQTTEPPPASASSAPWRIRTTSSHPLRGAQLCRRCSAAPTISIIWTAGLQLQSSTGGWE
jgi:hypothetical protein